MNRAFKNYTLFIYLPLDVIKSKISFRAGSCFPFCPPLVFLHQSTPQTNYCSRWQNNLTPITVRIVSGSWGGDGQPCSWWWCFPCCWWDPAGSGISAVVVWGVTCRRRLEFTFLYIFLPYRIYWFFSIALYTGVNTVQNYSWAIGAVGFK